jgi:hypothetical protein
MSNVTVSRTYPTSSPQSLWGIIGAPGSLADWHPAIAQSLMDGDRRTLTLADGAVFLEDVTNHSDDEMTYSYAVVESPVPVTGFTSTLSVQADGAGARATWAGDFEVVGATPTEIEEMVRGLYEAGLSAVADTLEAV